MTGPKKSAIAALAVIGALMGSAVLAEKGGMGMGGPGGQGEGRGAMLIELFDSVDADKDGKITYAELEAHRKAEFDAADTNKDGALSADELSARALARFQEKLAERTQGMLDNMDNDMLRQAVKLVGGRTVLEASGGVTLERIRSIAETGVDYISTSQITMGAKPLDLGLDVVIE